MVVGGFDLTPAGIAQLAAACVAAGATLGVLAAALGALIDAVDF